MAKRKESASYIPLQEKECDGFLQTAMYSTAEFDRTRT